MKNKSIISLILITGIMVLVNAMVPHLHLNEHFMSVTSMIVGEKHPHSHGDDCSDGNGRAEECLVKDAYTTPSRSMDEVDPIPDPVVFDLWFGILFPFTTTDSGISSSVYLKTLLFKPYIKSRLLESVLPVSGLRAPPFVHNL
ncbi:MAG: hypothetical protein Q3998_03900 [Porphyromonas sp.]|nr:hypothetical protein [Porphyromonas sp.]